MWSRSSTSPTICEDKCPITGRARSRTPVAQVGTVQAQSAGGDYGVQRATRRLFHHYRNRPAWRGLQIADDVGEPRDQPARVYGGSDWALAHAPNALSRGHWEARPRSAEGSPHARWASSRFIGPGG